MEKVKVSLKPRDATRTRITRNFVDLTGFSEKETRMIKSFIASLKVRGKSVKRLEKAAGSGGLTEIKRKMKTRKGLNKEERRLATKAGLIDRDQEWFWTPEWQAKEKEADEDMQLGRISPSFDNAKAMIEYLHFCVKKP